MSHGVKKRRAVLRGMLFGIQRGRCCYCGRAVRLTLPRQHGYGRPYPADFATLEHLRRLADGGTDALDNVALSCHDCNSRRGSLTWVEFKTIRLPATPNPDVHKEQGNGR